MSTSTLVKPQAEVPIASKPRAKRPWLSERWQSFLLMLPSFIAVGIFVYGFISFTIWISLSNWRTLVRDTSLRQPLLANYADLFAMPRWQADLRNTVVFTIFFMTFSLFVGMGLAILLDRKLFAGNVMRNVFLFPYALSFVVCGVAWRWIFNPETGINILFNILGVNAALEALGVPPLHPGWATNPSIVLAVNNALATIWPAVAKLQTQFGIPLAMVPVAIAASWQLSGFVMAMYIGGMATISEEVKEAARIDGATEWQVYRRVVIPMLAPVTVSLVVLLLHTSLKIFDLVYTMTGTGPGFATDVPAIFVFEMMFKATRYNLASAASIVMLLMVGCVVIPYLASALREG